MGKLIDGKQIAKDLRAAVAVQTEKLATQGITPGLAVILVGDDPASEIYVRNKERAAGKVGVNAQTIKYPADASEAEVLAKIAELNADDSVDAILVQSPVPSQIDEHKVQEAIDPRKDVDGFHPENIGRLYANREGYYPVANTPHLSIEPHEQIYYNHEGKLLETSIGNIVLKIEDQLYTPPVHLGLLNGIYRQRLIADNKLKEKVLTLKDMEQAQAIYGCNAVRGLYELKVKKQNYL